jgi:hypothetical protein
MNNEGPHIYPRYIRPCIEEALADTPVVLLSGPRQAGKTHWYDNFLSIAGSSLPWMMNLPCFLHTKIQWG